MTMGKAVVVVLLIINFVATIGGDDVDKIVFPDDNVQADDALYPPQNVIEKFSFSERGPVSGGGYSSMKVYNSGIKETRKMSVSRESLEHSSGQMGGGSYELWDKSYAGGCSARPKSPYNAAIKCSSTSTSSMCRITCLSGYKFPNGELSLSLACISNEWVIKESPRAVIPHACEPICLPACQHSGICIAPGECKCPDNYMGAQCETEKKFCLQDAPLPANSKRSCSGSYCTVTCMRGYKFPDGSTVTNLSCKDGKWIPTRAEYAVIPDCRAVCTPACQNGGNCLSLNVCQCPPNFRGPQCQYSVENCSPKKLNFNGAYNCSGSGNSIQCSLKCPGDISFDFPPASVYSCNYADGQYLPQPIPQCQIPEHMRVIPMESSSNMFYKASNATISGKGAKKKVYYDVKSTEGDEEEDEWEEEIITKTEIKTKKKKKNKSSAKQIEVDDYDEHSEEMPGVYEMYLSQHLDVVYRIPKPAVCMAWNGNKVKTFDGVIYEADIHCAHTLLQDRLDGTFSIILRSCPYDMPEPCPHAIEIFIQNEHYTIENDGKQIKVFTPKKALSIPIQIAGLRVTRAGDSIRIELESIQTTILWDTNKFVTVEVTPALWNRTMGLCGTMDKDIANDFQSKDKVIHKMPQTFVDSWKASTLDKFPAKCTARESSTLIVEPSSEIIGKAELVCSTLLKNTKLSNCFKMFDMKSLQRSCVKDYTSCKAYNKNNEICSCNGIAVLAKDCQFQGIMLEHGWRDLELCPLKCPNGKIYKSCGPQFEPTCGSTVTDTTVTCQEGCFCPTGSILHNGTCIPPEMCPCTLHKKTFKPGSKIKRDCNTCSCQNGMWKCTTETCGARCSAIGDPHYTTFDGKRFDFMGICSYYLIKSDDLTIEAENVACPGSISADISPGYAASDMPSCTKSVTIKSHDMTIKLQQGKIVTVDGFEIKKFPKGLLNGLVKIREASSSFILVDFQGGLKIWWDGFSRVHIDAPATYRGLTKGLCGTFNSNQNDDFLTPEGDIETSIEPFADKWRVQDSCPLLADSAPPPHPCQVNVENKALAEEICSKIRLEAFEECHWLVDPEPFYEDCLYDVCASKNDKNVACPILATYATECSRQGYIANWRPVVPECAVKCPAGQIFEQCGGACSRTCSDIQSEGECKLNCVEGCRCPPHLVLDDTNECVPRKTCDCTYKGLTFKPNYKEVRPGNKYLQLCTCSEARWSCVEAADGDAKRYPPAGDLRSKCSAVKNEEFTTCESTHPVTCKNMHSTLAQTSPAECRPGCVCKSGYVLDAILKECVRPENCSCHHGGKSFKEGEKMTEDCNTCECLSGNWKCSNKKCPQTCTSWGDSHFETFDGKDFDFQGVCSYVLSKGKLDDGSAFSVTIQNILCGTLGVTCSRSVQISVMGSESTEIVILSSELSKPSIKTSIKNNKNGQLVPGKLQKILIHKSGIFVILEIPSLDVQIKWDRGTRVYVKLDDRWMNRVHGLCGNFNGDAKDDLSTPSSGLETNALVFGHSWKLEESCKMPTELIDACREHPQREAWAQSKCSILKTATFAPCHSVVPVDKYMKRCTFDTCACDKGGDCECLCTAVGAYAHACSMKGVPIRWRTPDLCPMQCDPTCSKYKPCISSCPVETCDNYLDQAKIQNLCTKDSCIEGCEIKKCEEGFIYSNDSYSDCVPKSTCKPVCQEKDGIVYYEGDITASDACHTCRCSRGKDICTGIPCPVTEHKHLFTTPVAPSSTTIKPFLYISPSTTRKPIVASTSKPLLVMAPTPLTIRPYAPYAPPTTGKPMLTQTLSCYSGWTVWINQDKFENFTIPSYTKTKTIPKKWKNGDSEPVPTYFLLKNQNGDAYCAPEFIKNIECRTVGSQMIPKATGQNVECSLDRGLMCYGDCYDFETRVFCDCGDVPPKVITLTTPRRMEEIKLAPTTTTTTTAIPDVIGKTTKKPWFTLGSESCDVTIPHVEYPGDCYKFRHCQPNINNSYTYAIKTCGPTMMYNPKTMTCDWKATVIAMKPECEEEEDIDYGEGAFGRTIRERCNDGMVYDPCAIPCGRSCHYYHNILLNEGSCSKNSDKCIGKCVPKTLVKCPEGKVWRDRETCVDINDCTCMNKNGTIVKPMQNVKESRCGTCQCIDNQYVCTETKCNYVTPLPPIGIIKNVTKVPPIIITSTTLTPPMKCDPTKLIPMIDGDHKLPDEAFSASSVLGSSFNPQYSRLSSKPTESSSGCWSPEINDQMQFLQVRFPRVVPLYGVIIRGSPIFDQYVTSFKLFHSFDEINFHFLADETDLPQIFSGSIDSRKPVQSLFKVPIEAKVVRLYSLTWHGSISVRMELLGCLPQGTTTTINPIIITPTTPSPRIPIISKTISYTSPLPTTPHEEDHVIPICIDEMGVENGKMSPSQVQVSSFRIFPKHKKSAKPIDYLKMSSPKGWRPFIDSPNEFVLFDFLEPRKLTGVKTMGGEKGWVKAYSVLYSPDKFVWNKILQNDGMEKLFLANVDQTTPKMNYFKHPINARYLKIVPIKWHETMEMKIEPLGCFEPYRKIPIVPTTTMSPIIEKIINECDVCEGVKDIPKIFENTCPCLPPFSWNGQECVQAEQCPCMVGHIAYDIGVQYETDDCSECVCVLGGISQCKPKKCAPCKAGLRRAKTNDCSCRCAPCPNGETLCQTSGACIPDEKWCDGVTDCPDDEINCVKIENPEIKQTVVEKLTIEKTCPTPTCPPGFTVKPSNNKQKMSQMFQTGVKGDSTKSYTKSYQSTKTSHILETPKAAFDLSKLEEDCLQFVCIPEKPKIDWSEEEKQFVIRCPKENCPKGYQVVREEYTKPNQCSKFTCEPIPQKDAVCNVTGRIFNTFDGTEIKFDICSHILARDISQDKWAIILRKNCTAGNYLCSKEMEVNDKVAKLSLVVLPNLGVRIGDYIYDVQQLQRSPLLKSSFVISKNGDNLLLISQLHGFWIKYGLNGDIKIGVSNKYSGTVDGLCGYFNNDKHDDKRMPSGKLAESTLEFGNSWGLKDVPAENCEPHACPKKIQDIAFEMCNSIRHETFRACGRVVNVDSFITKCLEITCDCLQKSEIVKSSDPATIKKSAIAKACKCATLQNFVVECLAADENIQLDTWRSVHNCEATCHAPFVHKDCYRRVCEPACQNFRTKKCPPVAGTCFSGCYCPEGMIRRGDTCIPLSECRDCVCDGFGKSQYVTYDRANFTFDGNCTYLLSRDLTIDNVPTFQVYATIGPCSTNTSSSTSKSSCTQALHVIYGSQVIHVQRSAYNKFETIVNGIKVAKLPYKDRNMRITESQPGELKVVLVDPKVEVTTLLQDLSFSIRVPSLKFGSKLEGLCGDCNSDATDDFKLNPKKVTAVTGTMPTIKEFANSWLADEPKLGKTEQKCHTDEEKKCVPLAPDADPCFKILDEAVFGKCHLLVDPIMYVSACQKDICVTGPSQKGACESIAAYARECSRNGLCVDWRRNSMCPFNCPLQLVYNACGCPESCETIKARPQLGVKSAKSSVCPVQKTEGCYCSAGKILHNGKCVLEKDCNACDDKGHIAGDVWYPDKCTECTCGNNTKISCSKTECSSMETVCNVGLVPVEVINNDACCKKFICVPKPVELTKKTCPEPVLPSCGPDQLKKMEKDGSGCTSYVCECKPKSQCHPLDPKPKYMKPGQKVVIDNSGCCPTSKIVCDKSMCPPQPKVCIKEFYELKKLPGAADDCCEEFTCEPPKDKCIVDVKGIKTLKNLNEKWPTSDPCVTEMCVYGIGGQLMIQEERQTCDVKCGLDQELRNVKDKCCGKCVKTKCKEGNNYYSPGQTWYANETCTTFTCNSMGDEVFITSQHETCPAIDCPPTLQYKKGCCTFCNPPVVAKKNCVPQTLTDSMTVGLVRDTHPTFGKCKNKIPIRGFTECTGACNSGTKFNQVTFKQDLRCECCAVGTYRDLEVPLFCENGSSIKKTISVPLTCTCNPCSEHFSSEVPIV